MQLKNLPVEILLQVYSYLSPEELSRMRRVDKQQNTLVTKKANNKDAQALWKNKLILHFPQRAKIELAKQNHQELNWYNIFVDAYSNEYKLLPSQKHRELCSLIKEHQQTDKKENLKRIKEKIQSFDPKYLTFEELSTFFFYYFYEERIEKAKEYIPGFFKNHIFESVMSHQDIKDVIYAQINTLPNINSYFRLRIAIKCNQIEEVGNLLSTQNEFFHMREDGRNEIIADLGRFADNTLLRIVVEKFQFSPRECFRLLFFVCEKGDMASIEYLLKRIQGQNINEKDFQRRTLLSIACQNGHIDVVNRLLEIPGIDFVSNATDYEFSEKSKTFTMWDGSPLAIAVKHHHLAVVERLLKEKKIESALTPLAFAQIFQHANQEFLRLILEKAAELNIINSSEVLIALLEWADPTPEQIKDFLEAFKNKSNFNINALDTYGRSSLYYAVLNGHQQIAKLLLEYGAKNLSNHSATPPLHCAVMNTNMALTQLILDNISADEVNQLDEKNNSALDLALGISGKQSYFNAEIANLLFAKKAKVNKINDTIPMGDFDTTNFTPLGLAAKSGNSELVRNLLNRGAEVNPKDENQYSPLRAAMENPANSDVVELLIKNGADVNCIIDKSLNLTPFHLAIKVSNKAYLKLLLENGANPSLQQYAKVPGRGWNNYLDLTALGHAIFIKRQDFVELLLEHGARVDVPAAPDKMPLHFLISQEYPIKVFVEQVAKFQPRTKIDYNQFADGLSPLNFALLMQKKEAVYFLLDQEIDVNLVENNNFAPPLNRAIKNGDLEIVQRLLEKGAFINHRTHPPLHFAIKKGKVKIAFKLLDREGIDINLLDAQNKTPLELSLEKRKLLLDSSGEEYNLAENLKLIACLIKKGAKFNIPSVFSDAVQSNDIALVELLMQLEKGNTAFNQNVDLHIATKLGHIEILKLLIKGPRININAKDHQGMTALHIAVTFNKKEIVEILLAQGADLSLTNSSGEEDETASQPVLNFQSKNQNVLLPITSATALHFAVFYGDVEMVKLLISNGADVNAQDINGLSPLHYAAIKCQPEIILLLLANHAQCDIKDKNNRTPSSIVKETWKIAEKNRILSKLNFKEKHLHKKVVDEKHVSSKQEISEGYQTLTADQQRENYRKVKLIEIIDKLVGEKTVSMQQGSLRKLLASREQRLQACMLFHNRDLTLEKTDIMSKAIINISAIRAKLSSGNCTTDDAVRNIKEILNQATENNILAEVRAHKHYFFTHSHLNKELKNSMRIINEFDLIQSCPQEALVF